MTPKYAILAGNYTEYNKWCAHNGISRQDALFIAEASNLRGRQKAAFEFIEIGSFRSRRDAQEILDIIAAIHHS